MRVCGLDVHKSFIIAYIFDVFFEKDENGKPVIEAVEAAWGRFERTWGELDRLAEFLDKNETKTVVMESSGPYAYMVYMALENVGFDMWMAHPRDNKTNNQQKTDKLDAERLVKKFVVKEIRAYKLPTDPKIIKLKRLTRFRMKMVSRLVSIKNEIRKLLDEVGIDLKKAFSTLGKGAAAIIDGLVRGLSIDAIISSNPSLAKKRDEIEKILELRNKLDDALTFELKSLLRLLREVKRQIENVENRIESALSDLERDATLLTTIPGVGLQSAAVILAEIGGISRFASPRRLASYAGLVPSVYQSGDKTTYGKLRSDCNRRLRCVLYQIALKAIRYSPRLRNFYERLRRRGKAHKQAVIAVARKIAVAIWHILTKAVAWNEKLKRGYVPKKRRFKRITLKEGLRILRELGYEVSVR